MSPIIEVFSLQASAISTKGQYAWGLGVWIF